MGLRRWQSLAIVCSAALVTSGTFDPGAAIAAPAQLYGKSVIVTWTEKREQRWGGPAPNRASYEVARHGELSVYVSSAGRPFNRLTFSGFTRAGGGSYRYSSNSSDQIGGVAAGAGKARNVSFSGQTMTSVTLMEGGARRILVTFNNDFSGCSAQVLTGKSSGVAKIDIHGSGGMPIELLSVQTGAASCNVQGGNVFGK